MHRISGLAGELAGDLAAGDLALDLSLIAKHYISFLI